MLPLPSLPSFLPPVSRLAAGALNALLGREPWAGERLARHAGKTVRFAWGRQRLSLTLSSDGRVSPADEAIVPDVVLTLRSEKIRLAGLPAAGLPDFAEVTHISGDAGLAQVVGDLARDLRWDPEDDLARVMGDIPASRLVSGARAAASGVRDVGSRLAANLAEYLSEETATLTGRPALAQHVLDVAQLQADADALERRIGALGARLARLDGSARC
ncbi:SCP2 domain-containing protein [Bordetella sp. FB-8]|uniref:ubiquinone biosynthesis accessory factor UbiJ n=1 Tax=Bordetella sp. FB-8 TaxID=1159870 RepID=UPI000363F4A4|nr:SCP2 sterol-binding domain-containing protein [Bordetella sp. FB-8]